MVYPQVCGRRSSNATNACSRLHYPTFPAALTAPPPCLAPSPLAGAELLDTIEGGDPPVLHAVRMWVVRQLALRLRPQLEELVKANDDPPATPYQ